FKDSIPPSNRGEYLYLKGRALNIGSEYNKEAEEHLGKATKFNLPPAWNELGECLYKKGELLGAKTCFQKALNLEKQAVYLRNMSMLMRSLPTENQTEKEENIAKGLEYAREALKLNFKDGHSWLVLGNSYLTLFFSVEAKQEHLKNAKSAYIKAEEDSATCYLPELHFSKFQSLQRATELEPTWDEPRVKLEECKKFLSRLCQFVESRGQLTQRKLNSLMKGISDNCLGPYEKGGTSLTGGMKPILVPLKLLAEGSNENKIVLGRVVCTVVPDSGLPFAFCMVDRDGTCRAVTVYNWANNYGVKIGDAVAIVAPILKRHKLQCEKIDEFYSLRVALPLMLVINKRAVTTNQISTSRVVSCKKD
ncbi:Tetratricopeptide repeat protein 5, partial [Armadillidium vulgare]